MVFKQSEMCQNDNATDQLVWYHEKYAEYDYGDWLVGIMAARHADLSKLSVLDLGCGVGKITLQIRKVCPHVVGVDSRLGLVKRARLYANKKQSLAAFVHDDIELGLPQLRGERFDIVTCNFAYMYVKPEKMVEAFRRTLKPGGTAYVSGHGRGDRQELLDMHKEYVGPLPETDQPEYGAVSNDVQWLAEPFTEANLVQFKNKLTFPTIREFLNYYSCTVLYQEARKEARNTGTWPMLLMEKGLLGRPDVPPISFTKVVDLAILSGLRP